MGAGWGPGFAGASERDEALFRVFARIIFFFLGAIEGAFCFVQRGSFTWAEFCASPFGYG
jgi:hypothetical protein